MIESMDAEGYEFRMDEMAWFDSAGQINATLTELSTLPSDERFETWITVIRAARVMAKGSEIIPEEGRTY